MNIIFHLDICKFDTTVRSYWKNTLSKNLYFKLQASEFLKECKQPKLRFHKL